MLSNLKISTRLTLAFGLLTALLLAVVAAGLWRMGTMRDAVDDVTDKWLPSVEHVNQMNTGASDLRITEFQHVLNTDATEVPAVEKTMGEVLAAFEEDRKAYVPMISGDEERRLYDSFAAEWQKYIQLHDKIVALSRAHQAEPAKALLQGESQRVFDQASAALDKLAAINSTGAQAAKASSESAYAVARNTLGTAGAIALVLAVLSAGWLIRSITGPLRQALAAAERVGAGDLSGRIDARSHDEVGQVLAALQHMQESLAKTVSSVRGNAESVATASNEISQGNLDLSQRTEEQASNLQQTAASMEELSGTVKTSADTARQANQLATAASSAAVKGGEVVGQVVATMQEIADSSRRIADIIGTIDGIAFQTNILALNAAVEAARAGEQGRGFAVVASEVRSLAQRSADAAKEIKTLIGASVDKVEAGTRQVDEAGRSMDDIVVQVKRVSDLIGEISSAATEQTMGISQVGDAVTQLDQVTQQNAALVEESAAAAESLKHQAANLVNAVAVFKLGHGQAQAVVETPRRSGPGTPVAMAKAKAHAPPAAKSPVKPAARPAPAAASPSTVAAGDDDWAQF